MKGSFIVNIIHLYRMGGRSIGQSGVEIGSPFLPPDDHSSPGCGTHRPDKAVHCLRGILREPRQATVMKSKKQYLTWSTTSSGSCLKFKLPQYLASSSVILINSPYRSVPGSPWSTVSPSPEGSNNLGGAWVKSTFDRSLPLPALYGTFAHDPR